MSRVFAYCRVSTIEQTTDNQVQEIAAAGFKVTTHRTIVAPYRVPSPLPSVPALVYC